MLLLIVLYRIAGTIVFFLTLYQLAKALVVVDRIRDRMIYLGFLALNILLSSVWVFLKPIPGVSHCGYHKEGLERMNRGHVQTADSVRSPFQKKM